MLTDNIETGIAIKKLIDKSDIDYDILKGTMSNFTNIDLDAISQKVGMENLEGLKNYDLEKIKTYKDQTKMLSEPI